MGEKVEVWHHEAGRIPKDYLGKAICRSAAQ